MAEFFVKSISATNDDSEVDLRECLKKGDIVEAREDGFDWPMTMVPHVMVLLRVPGITVDQAREYLTSARVILDWEVVISNAQGKRIRVWNVDTSVTYALTRSQVEPFIVAHGGSIKSVAQNEVVFDIPSTTDFVRLKGEISVALEKLKVIRRYQFSEDDVDSAISAGGVVTLTPAQALARILDKAP